MRSLVANQIRGLGVVGIPENYQWDPLSFGWSLRDVFGINPIPLTSDLNELNKQTSYKEEKAPRHRLKDKEDTGVNTKSSNKSDTPIPQESPAPIPEKKVVESEKAKEKPKEKKVEEKELSGFEKAAKEEQPPGVTLAESLLMNDKKLAG